MIRFARCITARLCPMPLNQFVVGSLTSVFLANSAMPVPASTLSEKAHWIKPVNDAGAEQQPRNVLSAPISNWKTRLAANAHNLSILPAGWDGPGSVSISATVLSRAVFYVESALQGASRADVAEPRLVPGGDGSVQIE